MANDWGTAADSAFAEKCQLELNNECGLEYDLFRSDLQRQALSFYPKGTWLCHLRLAPQTIRKRRQRRVLGTPTSFHFLFRPSKTDLPIIPLGNDTIWILRANSHYGLRLAGERDDEGDALFEEIPDGSREAMMRRIIEYLHFYYSFTRYDAYAGGPVRFRVPRRIGDLRFHGSHAEEDRQQAMGALWRFLDRDGRGEVQPAIGTVVRFIGRYHADIPIQVASSLWRLRVSVRLRSGYVRLYGRVPFFYSPHLLPPAPDQIESLPTPRQLYWFEPWLLLPERMRAAIGAMTYFILAVTWLVALLLSVAFAATYVVHPAFVQGLREAVPSALPGGWTTLWLTAGYFILAFGAVTAFVFQFDGGLGRAARTAPGVVRVAYRALERFQRYIWDRFRPRLETPLRKAAMAALWLVASSALLVCSFTTLQVGLEPLKFAGDVAGQEALRTFAGHATIAFPGIPYLLGAIGFDPLKWLSDPLITSGIVLWFRCTMLVIVYRAFWKLLGYTSPRVLYRDSRRLEHELSKQKPRLRQRLETVRET